MFVNLRLYIRRSLSSSLAVATLGLTACSSTKDALLLGSGIGITGGALVGQAAGQDTKSTLIGAGIGILTGGLFSYLAQKSHEEKLLATNPQPAAMEPPRLSNPDVKRIWIPERIDGTRFEAGHWMYVIDKPVSWTR